MDIDVWQTTRETDINSHPIKLRDKQPIIGRGEKKLTCNELKQCRVTVQLLAQLRRHGRFLRYRREGRIRRVGGEMLRTYVEQFVFSESPTS